MALTVNSAFSSFLSETVSLDPEVSTRARSSRDWLLSQIESLPEKYTDFPKLYSDMSMHYGSFARRTKIKELDDLDILLCLSALGTTYLDTGGTITLKVPDGIILRDLCHDNTDLLNSRKLINRISARLSQIP